MNRDSQTGLNLHGKLTLSALAPLAVVLVLTALAAFWLINAWIVGETQSRVRQDLASAHEVLQGETNRIRDLVRLTAPALAGLNEVDLEERLSEIARREGLDFLCLTDASGRLLGAAPRNADPALPASEASVEKNGAGALLLSPRQLAAISPKLSERAVIALVDEESRSERRGMVLAASAPLPLEPEGGAYLFGGTLLNNNLPLIDRIRTIVYGDEGDPSPRGSATLFLDEVRIATTIRLPDGDRAIGTRISREVSEAVLTRREVWLDRAFVVDRWYLTAYEPIPGPGGDAIGSLYVGLPEAPYAHLKVRAALLLVGLLLLGSVLGYLVARVLAGRLSRPILELEAGAHQIAEGRRDIELPPAGPDEVGRLTASFNRMTEALKEQEEELRVLNRGLEEKVEERTRQLELKSLELIRTQQELMRAEKLAAVGELAAGVAHEINNPAAIIRGNAEILDGALEPSSDLHEETQEILKQTERISRITGNLLRFARAEAQEPEAVALAPLIDEILAQIGHQSPTPELQTRIDIPPSMPPIRGDREGLRQVFTNLLLNAIQAMEGRGQLGIRAAFDEEGVEIFVSDSGPGMTKETQEKIFNPFFTTKSGGTGLGLSLSYGIVRAHKGRIAVETEPGQGTTFRVRLPQQEKF